MRNCLICGNPLTALRAKYCNDTCSHLRSMRTQRIRRTGTDNNTNCVYCGKDTESSTKRYCSIECGGRNRQRRYKLKNKLNKCAIVYTRNCISCGKTFETKRCNKLYCTDECRIIHNYERTKSEHIRLHEDCTICGKRFIKKHDRSKVCDDPGCKLAVARNIYNSLSDTEKQARLSRKTVYCRGENIETKCPMCGVLYLRFFKPCWIGNGMPRVMCDKCETIRQFRHGINDILGYDMSAC